MPRGDGTGPMGMGPMTGRGAGFCAGYGMPGFMNPLPGRGFGMMGGRAGGRGWRRQFYATGMPGRQWDWAWGLPSAQFTAPTQEQQIASLKDQAAFFENALADIRKRMEELETTKP